MDSLKTLFLKLKSQKIYSLIGLSFLVILLLIIVGVIGRRVLYKSGAASVPMQTISGTLYVVISDDVKNNTSKTSYFIDSTPVNYIGTKKLKSGTKVNAVGVTNPSNVFEINEAKGGAISPTTFNTLATAGTQSVVTGTRKVAVVLLNWSDQPAMPYPTRADVLNMFSPTNTSGVRYFYKTSSFGQLDLTLADADIFGWYTTSVSSGGSLTTLCQKFNALYQGGELRSWLATNHPEINNANYQNIIYMMPTNFSGTAGTCTPTGLYGGNILLMDTYFYQPQWGYNIIETIVHELGHNFGANHASNLNFDYPIYNITGYLGYDEYGDYWGVMGKNSFGLYDFSGYHKNLFGWMNPNNIQDLPSTSAIGTYTYTLYPIETDQKLTTNKQMLRVYRDATTYYEIESRALLGVDSANDPSNGVQDGAMIRLYDNVNYSAFSAKTDTYLLRTSALNYKTWPVGSVLEDLQANLKITVQSKVNNVLTIKVEKVAGTIITPSPSPTPTPVPATFSGLSATSLTKSSATFNFTYSGSSTSFSIDTANTPQFNADTYPSFGTGASSPVVVADPAITWTAYCGSVFYWRVRDQVNGVTSPVQTATANCTATSTPTPTPNITDAQVDVYIGGTKKNTAPYSIPSNTSQSIRYGVNGGPVRVISTNNKPIFTSQRAIYGSSFNSIVGIPANQLTTDYWFTSLDDIGMITYLVVGNPSTTQTATVDVYIGGTKKGTYSIAPGQRIFPRYGVNGGPVRVVSTNGVPVFTSERTKYGTSFNEVLGIPANQLTTDYWFTSLDDVGMVTYLVVGNPNATLTANVDVYISGTKKGTYSIAPGQRIFPRYGVNGGPVRVVSTNGVPIFTSERSKFGSSFNEVLGIPANQLTTDYWFTSLDDVGMITYLVVGNPDTSLTATVDVYIGGTKKGTYSIAPGQRIFPRYGVNGGPVRVVSTNGVPVFTSERAKYQSSFNEIVGIPANQLTTDYWFTSLDDVGMTTNLVISAP